MNTEYRGSSTAKRSERETNHPLEQIPIVYFHFLLDLSFTTINIDRSRRLTAAAQL
jgi:hypothetical protein